MGRDENKEDKRARLREAALSLFLERGFDATTTHAVAERAGVAKGTLFLYAETKEDLVALVFEHRLGEAIARAFATLPARGTPVDEALHVFDAFFALYEPQPELARIFVRELMFPKAAAEKVRAEIDRTFLARLADRVSHHARLGAIAPELPADAIARLWFGHYVLVLIAWVGGRLPSRAAARSALRASLELTMRGLSPRTGPHEGGSESWGAPPPRKPATSTRRSSRSARTAPATSSATASATAATKTRGSRSRKSGR